MRPIDTVQAPRDVTGAPPPNLYEESVQLYRAYRHVGRDRDALAAAMRALDLRPDRVAYMNLCAMALDVDAFDVAIDANRRALELDATYAMAHSNLGWIYHLTGRYPEAIAACETAIALQPELVLAHVNRALSLLVCGDFASGWDEYVWTWRLKDTHTHYPYLDRVPLWNGEAFVGRQLLITLDQGFGDAIQMVRYLPAVKLLGGRVVLEVQAALARLFAALPGVDELRVQSESRGRADDIDLQIPLMGLPRAFATDLRSIPAAFPYLHAPPERAARWRARMRRRARVRVGIVWAGNTAHANDRRRSVRLEDFAGLGAIEGIAWFGLQKGRHEARRSCDALTLDPLGAEIADFADAAAIVAELDLVIAVDTAIVHLAGALGTPVWTLLPFAPDWRWLCARDDSPWYPTMRLFRQPATGDWASVFAEIARELRVFIPPARTHEYCVPACVADARGYDPDSASGGCQ